MTDCPFPPGSFVAAYLRDSGGDEQDQSVPQQEIEVRKYCAVHDLVLTTIYTDEARPGKTTIGRDGFWRLINHFRSGADETGLLIWRSNRFGRNINDSQFYKADLRRRGYIVHSLKDRIPEGKHGQLIEFVLDWNDDIFLEKLSEDVRRGLRQLVEVFRCVPGVPPRGFVREPVVIGKRRDGSDHIAHRWIPDPDLIPVVRQAFSMRAAGATVHKIHEATRLYNSLNSYTTFFRNKLFIGILEFGDIIVDDYCDPIVPREIWDEAQRVGRQRSRPRSDLDHPRRVVSSFLLSGLLHCQECGSPMSGYSMHGRDYYVCSRRKRRRDCPSRRIPRAPIEEESVRLITDRLLSLENLLRVQVEVQTEWEKKTQETQHERRDLERRLASTQARIRNVTSAISEHGHSRALLNQLAQLEIDEGGLRADLDKLDRLPQPAHYTRPQLSHIAEQIKSDLTGDDPAKKRAAIRGVVARIIAKRTDDQILGIVYCNKVIGQVPPRGGTTMTLFYPIAIPIRKRKTPLRV